MVGRRPVLGIDYPSAEREILRFIRRTVKDAAAKGVVLGLSGGIDSAVVGALCVKALGRGRVTALIMPSNFTPEGDTEDAKALASKWGVRTYVANVSLIAEALSNSFGLEGGKIPKANIQARVRMVLGYYVANSLGLLVAGTGDKSEDILGYFCYDSKTRVVTPEGPKGLNELKSGDMVLSLDPISNRLVEATVDEVHKFDYDGEMIQFRGRGVDLLVTPNHRMLVHTSSSNPNSKLIFRQAKECLKYTYTITPLPSGWSGSQKVPTTFDLSFEQRHIRRAVSLSLEDALYMFGLFIGDGCVVKGKVKMPVQSNLSRLEYQQLQRDGEGRFLVLPPGKSQVHLKEYPTYETVFALPDYTKANARERLLAILDKHNVGYSVTRDTVRISSKGIHDTFAQCGIGARNKHIPAWILQYPSEYLVHLLRGLKDSDGSHSEDQNVFYTSSEALKDDFVQLCFKVGRRATARLRGPRESNIRGKAFRTGPSFEVSFSGKPRLQHAVGNRRCTTVHYAGPVWCPSVPPYENILVERNGKYIISGNTKHGDGGVDFLPIAHLYKMQVRELGRRLGLPERVVNKPASPQLWPGHTAAEELPADYDKLDPLLYYLFDAKMSPAAAAKKAGVGADLAGAVMRLHRSSAHKRRMPPMVKPW